MSSEASETTNYSIGAVARLTGIPVDTVRMWERRYGVVQPKRNDGNKRRYSRAEIDRLTLIKRLVERGNPISTVATLTEQQLRERLQLHERTLAQEQVPERPRRTLIFGETLPFDPVASQSILGQLELGGAFTEFSKFEHAAEEYRAEILICEFPALTHDNVLQISNLNRRVGNLTTIIVYTFASSAVVQRLRQRPGTFLMTAPVTLEAVATYLQQRVFQRQPANDPSVSNELDGFTEQSPRRYTSAQLAAIARQSSSIKCECPSQLVDLLYRLCAFEAYSLDCENRNEQDQAIHTYLYHATAHARTTIEKALAYLIELEGISLEETPKPAGR